MKELNIQSAIVLFLPMYHIDSSWGIREDKNFPTLHIAKNLSRSGSVAVPTDLWEFVNAVSI